LRGWLWSGCAGCSVLPPSPARHSHTRSCVNPSPVGQMKWSWTCMAEQPASCRPARTCRAGQILTEPALELTPQHTHACLLHAIALSEGLSKEPVCLLCVNTPVCGAVDPVPPSAAGQKALLPVPAQHQPPHCCGPV
jgi:hypothetical protein